ncbi:hypothetical protein C2R22_05480 [Salinigranum rubrum]|uniref:Uncharacterized protein n=1 Tax=Salinigranum rubrum TaxID=755307 RepID=A0A2I8VGW7_9EURY|nr:hypothetical protein [Salinigranum rubrum]AUV81177.1 hypothetical protein C2R22_05480 [Salinigranum rubrum]
MIKDSGPKVSAAGTSSTGALAVTFLVGIDASVVAGLAGSLSPDVLPLAVVLSSVSAFRGLVLDLVIGAVSGRDTGSTLHGLVGLVGWFCGSLLAAVVTVWD